MRATRWWRLRHLSDSDRAPAGSRGTRDPAFKSIQVTSAARAAAQYAAMNGGNYMDTRSTGGIQAAAKADAPWDEEVLLVHDQ